MNVSNDKLLMSEAATLYYEKNHTQQEIADMMGLSRQTVSRLLNDAIKESIVEIKVHNPKKDCAELEKRLCEQFRLENCIVCGVASRHDSVRSLMTVKEAVDYILPMIRGGGLNIALSWGRTIEQFINALPEISTSGNKVFPLFGATDHEKSCFSSNELARGMADKIGANVKYAWFPYLADSNEDCRILKKLSYYKNMQQLWNTADLAIVGIGNAEILEIFGNTFGYSERHTQVLGDIATHFFTEAGDFIDLYHNSLCADIEDLKNAKQTIAIAWGDDKARAIAGALRTGLLDTLITDEYTARKILDA